jgi:hypothetical protein
MEKRQIKEEELKAFDTDEVKERLKMFADEPNVEKIKSGDAVIDYTVRRKKIYKGKMAPQGAVYIVISMKTKTRKLEAHQLIPGLMGDQFEKGVAEGLRDLIKKKYDV